jgi:serine/threonine protein phosphatase PrpC
LEVYVKDFFRKLFGGASDKEKTPSVEIETLEVKVKKASSGVETEPVVTAPLSPEVFARTETGYYPPQIAFGTAQSSGMQRDHNEDALFALSTVLASDNTNIPFGLFIIADGMGGHQHGEVASGVAIRAMASFVIRRLLVPMYSPGGSAPDESLQEILQAGVLEAHQTILKEASGGGTTLTTALILGSQLMISHVGDSRAYAIHPDGRIHAITRDHSLVKRLEELGQITSSEAAIHPQRNVLYRALGQGEPFEPDVTTYPLPRNGHILLCSDGLWGVISESDMIEIIRSTADLKQACHQMVESANNAGGPDNISVILIRTPE